MRVLAFVPDAFGGYGGIALYNRDVLTALSRNPDITEVVAIPRSISREPESIPGNLDYVLAAAENDFSYARVVLAKTLAPGKFNIILCGHINLIPLAWLFGKLFRIPVVLQIYGIDAWEPTRNRLVNRLVSSANAIISISEYTKQRFLEWNPVPEENCRLVPNAIHLEKYGEKEKQPELLERYGLREKKVLLTLGRLVSRERAKGFDELIELLPELSSEIPSIVYVIAGDGEYREELKEKAKVLGVADKVVFTGMVKESEKADLYRLADVYAMPSRGEGFGFVFLEAMACGIPVVASKVDGSRDAVRNGELGIMVDPDRPEEVKKGIIDGLSKPRRIPSGLEYFSFDRFSERLYDVINQVVQSGVKSK